MPGRQAQPPVLVEGARGGAGLRSPGRAEDRPDRAGQSRSPKGREARRRESALKTKGLQRAAVPTGLRRAVVAGRRRRADDARRDTPETPMSTPFLVGNGAGFSGDR